MGIGVHFLQVAFLLNQYGCVIRTNSGAYLQFRPFLFLAICCTYRSTCRCGCVSTLRALTGKLFQVCTPLFSSPLAPLLQDQHKNTSAAAATAATIRKLCIF